jgi:microcystin degradation protein MlrC
MGPRGMKAMRIGLGGFLHETNTFAPTKATVADFERGGGWPAMARRSAVIEATRGVNIGMSGFVAAAEKEGWELAPILWCAASPSAHVRADAYERIVTEIVGGLAAGPLDGIYLDLHGAMVAEHVDDGEGELLARLRRAVGNEIPLVVSLDLHANVTPLMMAHADALIAYRTYPHIDMADTGRAAARHMARLLGSGRRFAKAFRQAPFLIPVSWQCTSDEPCKQIYADLAAIEGAEVPTLSFTPGFPAADFHDCGPAVMAYGETQGDADAAADAIMALVIECESRFDGRVFSADEGVARAMQIAAAASKPVVIADTQDNPGAGGDSDTTGMLRALVSAHAEKAALGVMVDPESAKAAHAAGVGQTVTLALGGKSGIPGDAPFEGEFVVEELSDGHLVAPGPYYGGARMNLGLSACLSIGGVRVVVASRKAQLADQAMYRFVGIEPTEQKILVNKSSVHFRADFEAIAETILISAAPGAFPADPSTLPWTRLRPGLRTRPNGCAFSAQR